MRFDASALLRPTRRDFIRIGSLSIAGLSLASTFEGAIPRNATGFGRARRVILIFLSGGPSHIDLWDPKPDAPSNIRGDLGAIRTKVPGIILNETMPRLAQQMDKCALIRSMSFTPRGLFDHAAAVHETLTGDAPANASLVGRVDTTATAPFPYVEAGGSLTSADRNNAVDFERYGRSEFGRSVLIARRLIETGTRFVQVNWPDAPAWDAHSGNFRSIRETAPKLDAALSALIEDLHVRGLLEETLVVATGEFGRSPRVGVSTSGNFTASDGRDHWPYCYTALIAGAGVAGGQLFGASDATGSEPREKPVHPRDLLATIFHATGQEPPSGTPVCGLWS